MESRGTRIALGVWVALTLAFLYIPIAIICLYAFNSSNVQSWPIAGLTTKWFRPAIHGRSKGAGGKKPNNSSCKCSESRSSTEAHKTRI